MSGLFHQLLLYSYSTSDATEKVREQEECILFLLSSGASPIDNNGDTIMHYVCTTDHIDFISALAEDYNELLDYANQQNKTPLMWAISKQSEEAVVFLLAHGVDINATDVNGKSVLDYAQESENQRIIDLIAEAIDSDLHTS
jgi:ankyrin repeat protein